MPAYSLPFFIYTPSPAWKSEAFPKKSPIKMGDDDYDDVDMNGIKNLIYNK
jgi:hypothetical protein